MPSIYRPTSSVFEGADGAAPRFALEKPGYVHSRLMNPAVYPLQARVATLEDG